MADIVSEEMTLSIENLFVDGDTRAITLKNPKMTSLDTQLENLNSFMQTKNILIGDKDGATFGRIQRVNRIIKDKKYIDLDAT